jgi:D-glycero-D-manno-heptose 1,7-bisphosphate phosphatase
VRSVSARVAAFLDRDGTINVKAPAGDYVKSRGELRLLPGAAVAIRQLNVAGALVIVVTNQRGIALGRMSSADLVAVHAELSSQLQAAAGAHIDAFLHCPHDLGECDCRKPGTGLLAQALARFPEIDLARSVLIGDSASDIESGRAFGVRSLRIGADLTSLQAAVALIGNETAYQPAG